MKRQLILITLIFISVSSFAQQKKNSRKVQPYYVIVLTHEKYTQNGMVYSNPGQDIISDVKDCTCLSINEDMEARLIDNFERPYDMRGDNHFSEIIYTFSTYKQASDFRRRVIDGIHETGRIGNDDIMYGWIFTRVDVRQYSYKGQ